MEGKGAAGAGGGAGLSERSVGLSERSVGLSEADVRMFITNMRQMSEELKTERELRAKEAKEGISVLRLHVPAAALLTIIVVLVSAALGAGAFVTSTKNHMSNTYVHADEKTVLTKGGIAYTTDVRAELASAVSDLEAADRRIGRAVRSAKCSGGPRGVITCSLPDPETLPLRP